MGIQKLMEFLKTKFPSAIIAKQVQEYHNKTIVIDASNWIYQLLIKAQTISKGNTINMPMDESGNQTGHLIGILSRVAFCLENGTKPIWVFDGQPPEEKGLELRRRKLLKQSAEQKMEEAIEEESAFDLLKMSQRSVRITEQEKTDAKTLLTLMGLPVIQSPSEAEPQCAEIVKSGLAYGTATEDMDTLAFGCPILIRSFHKSNECLEVELAKILRLSGLTYEQFIDFCILCGCDYSTKIKNIGPVKAYSFIEKYKNIENILEEISKDEKLSLKHSFDDDFNFLAARKIFKNPNVLKITENEVKINKFQEEELIEFLKNKQFNENRINNWLTRIYKTKFYPDLFKL